MTLRAQDVDNSVEDLASGMRAVSWSAGLLLDPVGQLGDLVVDRAAFGHQLTDLAVGVHDRRVVPVAEVLADLGQ